MEGLDLAVRGGSGHGAIRLQFLDIESVYYTGLAIHAGRRIGFNEIHAQTLFWLITQNAFKQVIFAFLSEAWGGEIERCAPNYFYEPFPRCTPAVTDTSE